jgi:hypothetical protein
MSSNGGSGEAKIRAEFLIKTPAALLCDRDEKVGGSSVIKEREESFSASKRQKVDDDSTSFVGGESVDRDGDGEEPLSALVKSTSTSNKEHQDKSKSRGEERMDGHFGNSSKFRNEDFVLGRFYLFFKGQNKHRPPPPKFSNADKLCPLYWDGQPLEDCPKLEAGCPFMHDIDKYLG